MRNYSQKQQEKYFDTQKFAQHISLLPIELQYKILACLDPTTLNDTGILDNVTWRKAVLQKKYQALKLDYTGYDIFLKTPFPYLKKEYLRLNPLYLKAQALKSYLQSEHFKQEKVKFLFEKVTKGKLDDQVSYVKAIIGSNTCHDFILQNDYCRTPYTSSWIERLQEMTCQHSDIMLWLLASTPFQKDNKASFYRILLQESFLKVIPKKPTLIHHLLENETVQDIILSHETPYYVLYKLLNTSEEGLLIFINNKKLEPLKRSIFSAFNKKFTHNMWLVELLTQHPTSDQFFKQYPKFLTLIEPYTLKKLVVFQPKTFHLIELQKPHPLDFTSDQYLLMNFDRMDLKSQFRLLKKHRAVYAWLKEQYLTSFAHFFGEVLHLQDKEPQPLSKQIIEHFNNIGVKPVLIKREQIHMEYLLSNIYRDQITKGKLKLSQLLGMTSFEFLQNVDHSVVGYHATILLISSNLVSLSTFQNFQSEHYDKMRILYTVYTTLMRDAKNFLDSQKIDSLISFMQKVFISQASILNQLNNASFGSLSSLTLRIMIQTKHIRFDRAFQLSPLEVESIRDIDNQLNKFFNSTQKLFQHVYLTDKEQTLRYMLKFTPVSEDIPLTLQTVSSIIKKLPAIIFKSRTTQNVKRAYFFTTHGDITSKMTDTLSQFNHNDAEATLNIQNQMRSH